jgi:flagellar biosynthesis chaperone FliJ
VKPFQFRAQAAVDLRQREYDEARRLLARRTLDLHAAREVFDEAQARLGGARDQCGHEMAERYDAARSQWYRSWIVRLEHEQTGCANAVSAREQEVAAASAECLRTHQRLEALERFRDKAKYVWEQTVLAEEHKQIDALATLRHVSALRESTQRSRT